MNETTRGGDDDEARAPSKHPRDDAMAATIADAVGGRMYSPFRESSPSKVWPADAGKVVSAPQEPGTGWANEIPLASPPGQDAIAALVNKELPHGVANAISGRGGIETLRATIAKAQAMLEKLEREAAEKAKVEPPEE